MSKWKKHYKEIQKADELGQQPIIHQPQAPSSKEDQIVAKIKEEAVRLDRTIQYVNSQTDKINQHTDTIQEISSKLADQQVSIDALIENVETLISMVDGPQQPVNTEPQPANDMFKEIKNHPLGRIEPNQVHIDNATPNNVDVVDPAKVKAIQESSTTIKRPVPMDLTGSGIKK